MFEIALSSLMGYIIGSLSPSALLSKIKKVNLRKQGTGNLGATNTMLVLGRSYGVFVMLFDIFKAFAAYILVERIFKEFEMAGLLAGVFAVIGHIFPFYLKFRGGKGLAAFGGLVLSFDPFIFLILLVLTVTLIFILNYGVAMPVSAAALFPILAFVKTKNLVVFALTLIVSALIIYKHIPNLKKAVNKDDVTVREYLKRLSKP